MLTLEEITDMAALSLQSYEPDGGMVPNSRWVKVGCYRPDAILQTFQFEYNYQIVVFRNVSDQSLVLAHRGTIPTSLSNDLKDDALQLAVGNYTGGMMDFVKFSEIIRDQMGVQFPGAKIKHTGHSLGAATATIMAAMHGEAAVVFDSPGVQNIIDKTPYYQRAVQTQLARNDREKIHIFISTPNVFNSIGKQLQHANIVNIDPYHGVQLTGFNIARLLRGHSMNDIYEYFINRPNNIRSRAALEELPALSDSFRHSAMTLPSTVQPRNESDMAALSSQGVGESNGNGGGAGGFLRSIGSRFVSVLTGSFFSPSPSVTTTTTTTTNNYYNGSATPSMHQRIP